MNGEAPMHPMREPGVLDNVREFFSSFDLDAKLESMGITYSVPVQAALCFGFGFAVGFLFKKSFKILLVSLIVTCLIIMFLESYGVLTMDWPALKALTGFAPEATVQSMVMSAFDWIRENILVFGAGLIGFLLGNRFG